MNFQDYIRSELLILIPVLYCIGAGLKKSPLPDKWIPAVLGVTGVLLSGLWVAATTEIASGRDLAAAAFSAATQGILAAGASVYVNQLYVQAKKDESQGEET